MSRLGSAGWPAVAVVAVLAALPIAYGAGPADAALLLLYQFLYCLLPGWLAYRALANAPGGLLRQVSLGWIAGLALEIIFFELTASIDLRGLFVFYPLIVAATAVPAIRARADENGVPADDDGPLGPGFRWACAAVCIAAVGLIAVVFFPLAPLPGNETVTYFRDYLWHLSIAGEALNHWPILDPSVAGEPFPYHYFAHIHMAAAAQVTGVDLPEVYFRLTQLPLVAGVIALFVTAGRSFFRSPWVGLAAGALAIFVGDLDLSASQALVPHITFLGSTVSFLATSPSFLFGLGFLLALVVLVGEKFTGDGSARLGDWALLALVIFGATNAKVVVLPVILMALAVYAIVRWAQRAKVPAEVFASGAMIVVALAATYLLQYAGHSSELTADLFRTCLLYTSPSPRDGLLSRMPSSA